MKVLDGKVLLKIQKMEEAEIKIGDIVIKDQPKEYEKALVIEVGSKVEDLDPDDEVLIYPGAGKSFKYKGEEYRVVSSSEIIVVLDIE